MLLGWRYDSFSIPDRQLDVSAFADVLRR
jgi:hypothetical protein